MDRKTVEIQEAQTHLKELLSLVGTGTEIVLTEGNTPVARLIPIEPPSTPRVAGLHQGMMWTSKDFDEPLPETFWTGDK
jgi:prevent-host-death family protein